MRLVLVVLGSVLAGASAPAVAHVQPDAGTPWPGVAQGDCGYYSAFYLGSLCLTASTTRRDASGFASSSGDGDVFEGPVPRADCGPGSRPETGLQGEVPQADRDSGRSSHGYTCNLEAVGVYAGEGSTWSAAYYGHCAYYSTYPQGTQTHRGVVVVDASDPAHPRFSTTLTSPAMLSPHESLKVNAKRGLLAAVTGGELTAPGTFDVYDVAGDCARPKLLGSIANPLGHEGNWAPDGRTYYASGGVSLLTAIDVTDPRSPRPITTIIAPGLIHGLGISEDGNRLYLAHVNPDFLPEIFGPGWPHGTTDANGMGIYDVSQIQARTPSPSVRPLGEVNWKDGSVGQHAIPIRSGGRPHVVFVDEFGWGGPRIIDVGDEDRPRVVSKLKTEIQMPENRARAEATTHSLTKDTTGPLAPFGYNSHYCSVDRDRDPTIAACANIESGIRVFDTRNLRRPREIAYFNPGGDGRRAPASFAGATSAFAVTQPRILPDGQIWFTDQDRGLHILRFTNRAYPLLEPGETGSAEDLGLPPAGRRCVSRRNFTIRLRAPKGARLRTARVTVNGERVAVRRRRGRLTARVDLRGLPKRVVRVRIDARTTRGGRLLRTRSYRTCVPGRVTRGR